MEQDKNHGGQKTAHRSFFLCIFFFTASIAVGFGGGFVTAKAWDAQNPMFAQDSQAVRQSGYTFINPLLECEIAEGRINKDFVSFRTTIEGLVQNKKDSGEVTNVAIYFRDLNNGLWFGIDEKEGFIPASLLKLPIMLEFFKLAEKKPEILDYRILFKERPELTGLQQYIMPSKEIEVGKEYTVQELIDAAIIYSDNQATYLLLTTVQSTLAEHNIFVNLSSSENTDIHFLTSILGEDKDLLSVKNYATFFRILFNASYLNRSYSEKALGILSKVEYRDALVAGVPKDITVVHKFGEGGQAEGERQLHDCGIVYYPQKPYLLCVMTKGKDAEKLAPVIREISKKVYEEVDKQK